MSNKVTHKQVSRWLKAFNVTLLLVLVTWFIAFGCSFIVSVEFAKTVFQYSMVLFLISVVIGLKYVFEDNIYQEQLSEMKEPDW